MTLMRHLKKFANHKFSKGSDAKVLLENFASLTALKVLGYIFPLITLPYLAKVIGVDKFGELAFAASIIIYFQTLVDFGFNYTAVRDIARNKSDIEKVSKIFSTIMGAKIILMLISLFILTLFIFTIPIFYENRLILLLTFLYIPGYILFPDWFFQAMEEMKYITFLNLLAKFVFTGFVFIVIKQKGDYIFQPLLTAIGFLTSGIIAIPLIMRKYKVRLSIPSFYEVLNVMKESFNMFISLFLPNLYTNFSVILLKLYSGTTATGLYSSGSKFIDLTDQLSMVLSRTFYPFLARRLDRHKVYVLISFIISILMGLSLFFGAELLIRIFYTSEFSESVRVIRIMAISPLFLFLMNTYGLNYLVLIGKENILRNIILICSIGGFILTWIIVPKYSFGGVAATITIIWGLRGFLTWCYARKFKNRSANMPAND
jgi:O-antigen/teichoic acid export membrane protein